MVRAKIPAREKSGPAEWLAPVLLVIAALAAAIAPSSSGPLFVELVLLAGLPFALWFAWATGAGRPDRARVRLVLVSALPVAALAVSSAFAVNREVSFMGLWGQRTGVLFWLVVWSWWAFLLLFVGERSLRRSIGAVGLLGAVAGGLAAAQALQLLPGAAFQWSSEPSGFLGSSMALGQLLVLAGAALASRLVSAKGAVSRAALGVGAVAVAAGLVASVSRAGWLAFLVGCAYVVVVVWARRRKLRNAAGVVAVWFLGLGAIMFAALCAVSAGLLGSALFDQLQAATSGRASVWKAAMALIARHPWLGRGADQFSAVVAWTHGAGGTGAQTTFEAHDLVLGGVVAGGALVIAAVVAAAATYLAALQVRDLDARFDNDLLFACAGILAFAVTLQFSWIDPFVAMCAAPFAVALLPSPPQTRRERRPQWVLAIAAVATIAAVLTAVSVSDSVRAEYAWSRAQFAEAPAQSAALVFTRSLSSDPTYVRASLDALRAAHTSTPWTDSDRAEADALIQRAMPDLAWHASLALSALFAYSEAHAGDSGAWAGYEQLTTAAGSADPTTGFWAYLAATEARARGLSSDAAKWQRIAHQLGIPPQQ